MMPWQGQTKLPRTGGTPLSLLDAALERIGITTTSILSLFIVCVGNLSRNDHEKHEGQNVCGG